MAWLVERRRNRLSFRRSKHRQITACQSNRQRGSRHGASSPLCRFRKPRHTFPLTLHLQRRNIRWQLRKYPLCWTPLRHSPLSLLHYRAKIPSHSRRNPRPPHTCGYYRRHITHSPCQVFRAFAKHSSPTSPLGTKLACGNSCARTHSLSSP